MTQETTIIQVALLDEGVDVWRPVEAIHLGGDAYRILDQPYESDIETWQFTPGAEVICEPKVLSDGEVLVAVGNRQ
ncbi:MAG: hypothetical protein QNJ30_08905 [Kiloniellales bacterium]|nr:hypothetical protein [Kiloniellales bacterium]